MKKHFIWALLGLSALTACTDNDSENMNPGESTMSINKTITYMPAYENFQTRTVKYYENNQIVADSTYNNSGDFISRNIHTVNGNTYTITTKNPADVTTATVVALHDAQGRLTEYNNNGTQYKYTYSENGVSTEKRDEASAAYVEISAFMFNGDGYIVSQSKLEEGIITDATSLIYDGAKPVSLMAQGITGPMEQMGAFSYYPNSVPTNLQKSVTQINNEVLKANELETAAVYSNNHLQSFTLGSSEYYTSATVFSPLSGYEGYPQNQKITIDNEPYSYTIYVLEN